MAYQQMFQSQNYMTTPNIVVTYLKLLIHIWKIQVKNLSLETDILTEVLCGFTALFCFCSVPVPPRTAQIFLSRTTATRYMLHIPRIQHTYSDLPEESMNK